MSIIKVLPDNLVNQIAAGEVVERPSSVIKELVENSLDAGATDITVEVKDAGKKLIKVIDNGFGMTREDCELALQRHATSKITEEKDLWTITSMGFRGEALASISSVSKMTLKSKTKEDIAGTEIHCDGGNIVQIKETGMSNGTQIEVHNLFFNTPARQKYLKKDATELSQISSTFNTISLANPGVSFKLIHNGKVVSDLPKVTGLISRIGDIFGKATAEAFIPIFYGGGNFEINGFVGKPAIARSTTQHQYFFVNGRPIQNYVLANSIKNAFHSMLMENKKPVFIINIKIDPSLIDVNVHPRKIEIRFENQQDIIRALYSSVKAAIERVDLTPKGVTESKRYMSDSFPTDLPGKNLSLNENFGGGIGRRSEIQEAMKFTESFASNRPRQRLIAEDMSEASDFSSVFQIENSYIAAKSSEGLILIDQHAAHERVRYEQLMDQFENVDKVKQPLLVPQQLEFASDEVALIEENIEIFDGLGFEIEPFGGNTFIVNAVPGFLSSEDIDTVVKGVLDDIINQKGPSKFQGRKEEIINYMACRSAIKFGQSLSEREMRELIKQLDELKRPYTCPHGRPTMISLDMNELGKMFGRK